MCGCTFRCNPVAVKSERKRPHGGPWQKTPHAAGTDRVGKSPARRGRWRGISYGAASAIVTSTGLVVGFGAAAVPRSILVGALLIVGFGDNLTDSLSIHIYQESERLETGAALRATLGNFTTRAIVALSFVVITVGLAGASRAIAASAWGTTLLALLTWLVADERHANRGLEVAKHLAVALVVIVASRAIGVLVTARSA